MNRRQIAAVRLTDGTQRLARRAGERATTWIRAGRRADLDGWRASLGCVARAALLLVGLWLLWRAIRAVPALLWAVVPLCLLAAWRAGRPAKAPRAAAGAADEPDPSDVAPEVDLPAAIRAAAGPHTGAHLTAIATHLTQTTGRPWTAADVRAACRAASIPIAGSVRMGPRSVSTGVRLDALPDPSPTPSQGPAVAVVAAGQPTATGAATATATPPDDTTGEGIRVERIGSSGHLIVRDPADTARHHATR